MELLILARVFERHVCLASWLHIFPVHITLKQEKWPLSSYISYSQPVLSSNKEDVCDFLWKAWIQHSKASYWSMIKKWTFLTTGDRFRKGSTFIKIAQWLSLMRSLSLFTQVMHLMKCRHMRFCFWSISNQNLERILFQDVKRHNSPSWQLSSWLEGKIN